MYLQQVQLEDKCSIAVVESVACTGLALGANCRGKNVTPVTSPMMAVIPLLTVCFRWAQLSAQGRERTPLKMAGVGFGVAF